MAKKPRTKPRTKPAPETPYVPKYRTSVTWRGRRPGSNNYDDIASPGHYTSQTFDSMHATLSALARTALQVAMSNADVEITFRLRFE